MSTQNWMILYILTVLCLGVGMILMWLAMRRRFVNFTDQIYESIECILKGEGVGGFELDEDTLCSKIQMMLKRLYDITCASVEENRNQKKAVQEMVSDISHQLKTPISNITMYSDTILNHELDREEERRFLKVMQDQIEKLDFLVRSLMKMSRLENNMIVLKKERALLLDCVMEVVESIELEAKKKEICIEIQADEKAMAAFDRKWTTEALFNILDNAVKYTPENGRIRITIEESEMFSKVVVEDTGIGIEPDHINDIFKRFYREPKVHKKPGIGIGLYLSRQIIASQNGFIKVRSNRGEGSSFGVYLTKEKE
ncbi:sensor histidine kinase [uncultured Robinsoniella sp.]|uniref:sensor histidine kinase n=1 Tax=uncultured Robinsoniella sp. TaxID=904190 RepID=UPI00374F74E6